MSYLFALQNAPFGPRAAGRRRHARGRRSQRVPAAGGKKNRDHVEGENLLVLATKITKKRTIWPRAAGCRRQGCLRQALPEGARRRRKKNLIQGVNIYLYNQSLKLVH